MKACYYEHSNKGGIYKIINTTNERIYIGSAKGFKQRYSQHVGSLLKGTHHNKFLQGDFNKCGSDAFEFHVIEVVNGVKEERIIAEQRHVDLHYDDQKLCYNLQKTRMPSVEGYKQKEKQRLRKSQILKERWKSNPEFRETMLKANTGRPMPKSVRAALLESLVGNKHMLGKKLSEETKEKQRIYAKKRGMSEKTREAQRKAVAGRKLTDEHKMKISFGNKGRIPSEKQIHATSQANSKTYDVILVSPEGTKHGPIHNLRKFCLCYGILDSKIRCVMKGTRNQHKGWKLQESNLTSIKPYLFL
jgi:group I intron endonuclease